MFDPTKQYMDLERYDVESLKDEVQRRMIPQMEEVVPPEYRDRVTWISQHWPTERIRVKDDNYEMFGLTKDKIGTCFEVSAHWTLAWKTKPIEKDKCQ